MRGSLQSEGYLQVNWKKGSQRICRLVHRMVAEMFLGPSPTGRDHVLHCDGNKGNNALSNLRWGNAVDNTFDAKKHGTHVGKLDPPDVRKIVRMLDRGLSQRTIAKQFDVSQVTIAHISTGRTWSHLTGRA